ncbi:fibrous sheath-interacting protein 2 isoform X2 [Vicugna pacos]|uniref:Fibrous sheath-interacting protein 2 isoform X2 n=1 Tax=Vicugna pacos TaxID=30538 RepID=A0ABM5D8Z0_VICPA
MELYLSACSKAANVAASKTASSGLAEDSQQCGDGVQKTHLPGVGAAQLLDLPLGVKLPLIPGSNTLFYTTKLSEKLFRPSYGFNLTDPYCHLLENQYKSLHDPHLRAYHKRKDILRRLKKGGYITSNNKIVCTLRELNKYRQYLTSLKLDFERNYIREQKMLSKQVNKLQENSQIPGHSNVAQFQNWLLQEGTQSVKDQERLIRQRYLDMVSRELEQLERTAEEQRLLRLDREERRQREYTRRKLNLRRKIEEEWKTKEMLLLMRIGEDVKREARIEEQRRRSREESDRKKQALLEKKMAYHLQKMQDNGIKREEMRKNIVDYKEQDGPRYEAYYSPKKKKKISDDIKLVYSAGDQKTSKGAYGSSVNTIHQSPSSSKNVDKKSSPSSACHPDVQDNDTEQKKEGETSKKSSIFDDRGDVCISAQNSVISAQNSPTRNFPRLSHSSVDPPKNEKEINADWNRKPKRPSNLCESGPQAPATAQGIFPSRVFSNIQQNVLQTCSQEKVTSEELNSIIQNIMTWVVATVTSILYPAITKYEERLQSKAYPVSDDSILSSDSSSFCSTCSEEFTYGSYTSAATKTLQREPCTCAVDISVRRPATPLKPPSANVERTVVGKTYHVKGQPVTSELKYNKTSTISTYPKLRSCKSDSHLASFETGTKKLKDATTETNGLESPLLSDQKAKTVNEMKNLENVFVNFKCHLKGETELILESIFQEIISDLTQAIPSISSVTAEVFVDQSKPEKGDLVSNVDICSVASEIVENMLEKLQSAVEKKRVQMFSQEDLSVNIKPGLTPSGESLIPSNGKVLTASLPYTVEPMCDIAEDMVHAILEKLMTLASYKQNELPHLEDATKLSHQQNMTDPRCMFLKKINKEKCNPEPDATNLTVKEEIQNLISDIFSQSSLAGYIEEAVSTILGYVQTELNNERLIASDETVILLQLLDDIFTQLHQKQVKVDDQKCRHSRLRNPSETEEKYRLTGTRLSTGSRSGRPLPPINVPGMVLYSEDDNEEIDKIVENVLASSFKDEQAKSQEHIPAHWFTKGDTCLEYKRNSKLPTKPTSPRSKVAFCDRRLKAELPSFKNKEMLKEKPCLNKEILFSQDQKYQIQKASENIVKSILTEMLKDIPSVHPGHLDSKTDNEASVPVSEKTQGLSHQEWMAQMFSVSEISTVAQEITDAVLNILHKASCFPSTTKSSISSSVHQNILDSSDTLHLVKAAPNKKPLKIWFGSEKKMKYLSSLDVDPTKPSLLQSEETQPKPVGDLIGKIIDTVFKRLKLLVCPKLQVGYKPSSTGRSSLQSELSTYTTKVVNIVLHAIQNELKCNKKNLDLRETDHTKSLTEKGFFADTDELESVASNLNDDIMAYPLLTCICEMLSSGRSDQSDISLPSDNPEPTTSYGSDNVDKQNILPSRQDKKSFYKYLSTPCALHSVFNGEDPKENSRLQVLDSIGETLYEMLCKLIGAPSHCQPSGSQLNEEKIMEHQQTATELQSNIQLISATILEYILTKLCNVDMDTSVVSSGVKAVSESLDIDSLSFASIIEEMTKCTDIISSIISRMVQKDNKEMTKSKEKTIVSVSSRTGRTKEIHSNKLKAVASDILNTVFAKLEGFASGNLETMVSINDGNEKSSKMDLACESPRVFADTLQSALYMQAKKVSSTILKAIQTELNMNSLDLKTRVKTTPPEKQTLKNIINLILDGLSSDMFNETESEERGPETYRYRPTYGNFLPGGAESDSFLEDTANTEKEFTGERTSLREETKSDSLQQWVLERTLNKIEVKLKEPQKSPVIPIIRNILNEIFQSALVSQLNVLSLSYSGGIPQTVDGPVAQTSVQCIDKMMGPFVSEADVTVVTDDVVRTVFHKLYSVTMTERNASESRYKTITFSADVSFHDHSFGGGKPSITVPDKNPSTLQSKFSADKQAKVNIVEDIVQAILTNLEAFATSKVNSLFFPQINFTVPVAFPIQQDKSTVSKAFSAKDLYSDDQFSCCSVYHIMSEKTNSSCQLSLNKLNTYATEVARKVLQGIKHELDKERENPFLTSNIVVSESIASQIVNTVLDIISSKGKCDDNNSGKETDSDQQEGIEKLFSKTAYRQALQFQIQDTIESILCDIYEKTLYQNNLSFATPTLKCSIVGKHSRANSEMSIEGENQLLPKHSVPKSDVTLISNDMVDIVLHNLSSPVILGINAKDSTSARLPLTFCDMFPKAVCQQPLFMGSKSERKTEYFPSSKNLKSAYANDSQITVGERGETKKSVPDSCEENADFITKTIFNRLESFATERIDSLINLTFQTKEKSLMSPELENCKQDDSIFHESSQGESNVNILKISTETILGQELTGSTFASYREKLGSIIHLSQSSLKEYADFIASAILKLIKNDLDLEIQKMHPHPNNISFQENITVSENVSSILKILYDKRSLKEISFYSKDNPNLLSQLTVSNEVSLGQRDKEKTDKLHLFSEYLLEQNQMALETESQVIVLEEIFMRNEESKQKERTALFSAVEEVLNKVHQRIMKIIGYLPSFKAIPHFISNSKIKTSAITQKNFSQSHINRVANDIIESVLEKMYSVVVTTLQECNKVEADDKNILPKKPSCIRETKQAGIGSNLTRYVLPQVYPYAGNQNVSVSFLQYSPLQMGKDLVQVVLRKITNFASLYLEETLSREGGSDESQPIRLHSSKVSPKGSPKPSFKTNLKARSKVTPLPKFRTKRHVETSHAKTKSKTKLGPGEKTPKESSSKTAIGLPQILSMGDAKNLLETKLPASELKMYAKDIISNILKTTAKEFEKVKQARETVNAKALPTDQIMAANKIVNTVLQGLNATNNHSLANPIKFSHLDDPKLSQGTIDAGSLAKPQACFYLENVSSQLEQIFPKEGIFKKMFDKWQAESNGMENEKCKLLMIAENVFTEVSIKAKELEYSLSLLDLPHLEDCESRLHSYFKGASSRAEDTKAQINMFGREIVEMLFEKLQLCFLSQMPTTHSKETLECRKEHITTKSKHGFPTKDILSSVPLYNTKIKDQISFDSSNQIVREIVERVLNVLESFVDLQFKHISKYEFSEIVKMPIENLFPIQQRLLSKNILPKLQPLKKFSDESKSSTVTSKENVQNTLLQIHSFHSELLTYAVNIVSDMLDIIKNKLDKEISQAEPSSTSILKENMAASEIIGTLMDQCTHFSESLIKNLPKESLFQGVENTYIVNQVELATNVKTPMSKSKEASFTNNSPQITVPGLDFYSEEEMKKKYKSSSNLPSYARAPVEDTIKSSEPMERSAAENTPSCSRNKVQDYNPRESDFGYFDQAMKGNSSLPEGTVLQKLLKKENESTEAALKQVMSFIEMRKGANPRVFHYEIPKPVVEPNQIQTTVSPLKICLAAENIVNTVLSSYGFPGQPHFNESMETMKPFFISRQNPLSVTSGGQKSEEKSLLRMWDKRISYIPEEEYKQTEASRGYISLLQKWESKNYPTLKTLKEVEVIAFADHELGPNEIHLVARHVTTSVVMYFKNFETRVSREEKVSIVSTLSRKKYESKQPLRSICSDSSLYQFCEHLTESVICHLISSIPDSTKDSQEKEKAWERQNAAFNMIISIDSQVSEIQRSIISRSPIMVDRIASFIIQEIIENHLQPFLCGEGLPRPKTPSDAISNMVKQVLSEVIESHRPQTPSPLRIYPETFVREIVARLLSKIFSPKFNTEIELGNMTQKIVNSINNHFDKAEVHLLYDDKGKSYPSVHTDVVDELVTSVYRNVLKQHGLDPGVDKKPEVSDVFVEKITNLVVAAISDYLLHPLFSGDLSSSSYSISTAENIIQDVLSNISKSTNPSQSLSPYNTLLPYTFLEDMIRVLLFRIFPSASSIVPDRETPKDRSGVNFNEIASEIISDIRMKVSQHEIGFSKDEEETKFVYSEDDVQHLVDSVFKNISQSSESQASLEQNITSSDDVLIDRLAGFIIKHICQQHLQPFVDRKSLPSSYTYFGNERRQWFYASVYSSTFLEDVVSGVLSKIFHRGLGIVQTKSVKDSENELFHKVEKLTHLITEEFSKAQVSILENAEEKICLPPVERDTVKNIIDRVYSQVLQEYEMEIMPDKDFLNDTLAARITKVILAETFDFQIHPNLIEKLPFRSHSKLSTDVLIKKVQCDITKSRLQRQASTIYTTMLSHTHLEKIVSQLISQMSPLAYSAEHPDISQSELSDTVIKLINEIMSIISKHAICIIKHGNEKQSMISEKDIQSMVDSIYADLSHTNIYQSLTKDKKGISNMPVSKIASFIIKEIFNHHLQSFLSRDKSLLSAAVDQKYKQKAADPKQKELSCIVNSAVFLEEVISELLCKLLYAFSHNVLAAENPEAVKAKITGIVTTLVKSIVLEFSTSEILVADNYDGDIFFSEGYKEMVHKTVNLIYEKILDEYKSLIQIYRAIQSDTVCFGRKIYNLLLGEIYDYQVQSLVSGQLVSSSYSSPQADNIIRNVLSVIMRDSHALPSCITVLPRSLLEDIIYKLLVHIFPSSYSESEMKEEEVSPDYEFVDAASKLTDEIIREISEHEIYLATAEENAESMQSEVVENLVDSICSNILKKYEFQAEVEKDADKKGGLFLSKIAGFIMKEIMDHHLQPFLHGEESSFSNLTNYDHVSVLSKPGKEKRQSSLYSATFLEDVIVDLVRKFYSLPSTAEDSKRTETPEPDIVSLAIKFAKSLIGEFRKSEIKVLPKAEEIFSFPPIDKETVDNISNFVYDQFIAKYGSNDIQKDEKNNIVIEMVAALAQKAISVFKIQPLFSGDWSSTFFSFLNPDNITQRVQHLPQKTSTPINRCLKGNELTLPEHSYKHTSLTSDQKNVLDTLGIDKGTMSKNKSFKTKETLMKKGDIQDSVVTSVTRIMKSNMDSLVSGSAAGVASKKKANENKMGISVQKSDVSVVTSLTTNVKCRDTLKSGSCVTFKNNEIEKKSISASKDKERQGKEVHTQCLVATNDTECEKKIPGSYFEINHEKKNDKTRENPFKKEDKPFQLPPLTSKVRNTGITTEKTLKVTQEANNEERKDTPVQINTNEGQYSDYESVQNVIENIYENILEIYHSQESADYSKLQSPPGHTKLPVIQEVGKDVTQPVSIIKNLSAKEKEETERERTREREKERDKEKERGQKRERDKVEVKKIKNEPSKLDSPQYPPKSKPGIFPAKFLEDVITEMVNKLIFSSSTETQTYDTCQSVSDDENQAELYDTAMRLIDSLLKEFSDAQIKVFRPNKENQFFPPVSSSSKEPPRHKESSIGEASSNIKKTTVDEMPHMHKVTEKPSSSKIPFLDKISAIDETLVSKVVHSSVCNILKEYTSQGSICKNIKSNTGDLARRLTSAVINEIFQHKLNLILCDEVPASSCLPLETKDVVKKIQKVAQMASKECQTSSPYTIMLPHEFLENVISALLSKIFSTVSNTKAEASEGNWSAELDFLQMKLLSTVTAEISKDEDTIIQYVESLHPNDDEIIQLVVQSLYDNLLSQFGSQEIIQNCVASGCRILSETVVDLILREVAGNQLQNYFSGELTPYQCAEVDSVVENILKDVIETADAPQPQPSHARILPYNIIEEIAVKFLSKLLTMFPKVDKEKPKSLETEMQKITSKILNSMQEFISKSKIKVLPPAKDLPAVPLADNKTIETVVNSVYTSVLKHSGSHMSIFKDLMGKSNVLSDIIGFLMVKEISNSEFQPQVEEKLSNSELVLEAVKIMEKVVKIVDEFRSQEKASSKKGSLLDATFLEEALALFLAKIVRLPSASSKDAKNLSKPELNKIASQLTKSVTAEISKSNISLIAADPEERFLNTKSIEMISQVIDSIYSNILQQSGTHQELYYDIKNANRVFPKKVASLIINGVSNFPLDVCSPQNSSVSIYEDLDIDRIVQKAQEHAVEMIPHIDKGKSDKNSVVADSPIKIVPYVGDKPIKIDPNIISEHLAVISVKTQPLEKLKMECLKKTGHSIAELRRASISGRSYYSSEMSAVGELKRERRTSLSKTGRLDIKPFEVVCRNSFQNIRKPDITKVELLKDVRNKKELIIRLVAHDIDQEISGSSIEEGLTSDEDEVVLKEIVQEEYLEQFEDQMKEARKPVESKGVSPKPTRSTSSLKKFFSLSKCCQPTSSANAENTEATSNHVIEPKEVQVKRAVAKLDMTTCSRTLTEADSSWEERPQRKKEEKKTITEPTHYFIHRIMSSSSYNQEDLISYAGETEDCTPDTNTQILEERSQEQRPEYSNSVKFISLFEGNKNILGNANPSKEVISETPKPNISKQGSKMLAKVSSALSKVFSRTNANISKSPSPPHQDGP